MRISPFFWRKAKPAPIPNLVPDHVELPMPPMGSRELVEYWGALMDEARLKRAEAMSAYQATLKGNN